MVRNQNRRVLIIGAGSVGNVVTHKCAQAEETFDEIMLASKTLSKCKDIQSKVPRPIQIARVDANRTGDLLELMRAFDPGIVINVALPYQDLAIMEACIHAGIHYLDTANYESPEVAHFEYKQQWMLNDRFEERGIMGVLGCGFDPGASNAYCRYVEKHHLDKVETIDIVDCNAGDHHQHFATNFNPEINLREVTQPARYWHEGTWIKTPPIMSPGSKHITYDFPGVGPREAYLLYHEELESIARNFDGLRTARFWMTFSENYLTHLRVLHNVGMTRIDPVKFQGQDIVPLQFLKALLPDPQALSRNYQGKTVIGCHVTGVKNGQEKTFLIYNTCDHEQACKDVGSNAVAYTAGIPAACGAALILDGTWAGQGVFNVEQLDPDPFLDRMSTSGLPWHLVESTRLS